MMSAFFSLVEMLLVVFCIFSYVVCGYVAFFRQDEVIQKTRPGIRFFFWLLSPLVVLDLFIERFFGWSFMP